MNQVSKIIILAFFILAIVFCFFKFGGKNFILNFFPSVKQNNQSSDIENETAIIYFFYTTWCPYCKQAKEIFKEFSNQWNEKQKNKTLIKTEAIDCDINVTLADKYKVEGYPTIKMIYKNKIIEYDAKPNIETLNEFLDEYIK